MEGKTRQDGFNVPITVGFVGHVPIEFLSDLKNAVESIPRFDLVFFKTPNGRLWIKEGDNEHCTKSY